MLKVPDPDTVIATRLSGDAPFTARDVFAEREEAAAAAEAKSQAGIPTAAEPAADTATAPPEPPNETDLNHALGDFEPMQDPRRIPLSGMPDVDAGRPGDPAGERQNAESAQYLTLARTYLEMGLADEAIGPLETASRTPRFRFEAASTLGRLFRGRGDTAKAVEWLERAAEAPAPSDEESRALLYELGTLVEDSGDTARALAIFLELQSDAGDYRDVAERVERLARVETGG